MVNLFMRHEGFSLQSSKKYYMGVNIKLISTVSFLAYRLDMVSMYDLHHKDSIHTSMIMSHIFTAEFILQYI